MTVIKVDQKIISQKIVTESEEKMELKLETMHEKIYRPLKLVGSTYKIKPPGQPGGVDHALYITINDYVLNEGTDHEQLVPYEIFLNSKAMESFQWILLATRSLSAMFRRGGDYMFLIDEMCEIFDPHGGYFRQGKYRKSVVSDLGDILKEHLKNNGVIKEIEHSPHVKEILASKRAEFEERHGKSNSDGYPPQATLCAKCNTVATVMMDGCMTCLCCGFSKCQ